MDTIRRCSSRWFLVSVLVLVCKCVSGEFYKAEAIEEVKYDLGEVPTISGSGVFVVGTEKTLLCYVTSAEVGPGGSFPLTWTREKTGNTPLTPFSEQTTDVPNSNVKSYVSYYKFTVEKGNNKELFTCTARLGSTEEAATWKVFVYKPPDTPVIRGPTEIVSDVATTWQCDVDGASSAPNVYWLFGNGTRLQTGVTTIPLNYQDPDSAAYLRDETRLEILSTDPPVLRGATNYTVTVGETITVHCDMVAEPEILTVTWYKDGAAVDTSTGHYSGGSVDIPSLTIDKVRKTDVGEYICGATNRVGAGNSSASYMKVRYQPTITYTNTTFTGIRGNDLTVPCDIDAYPAYTAVFWWRISETDRSETTIGSSTDPTKYSGGTQATPSLTITNLTSADEGLYRCAADNPVGRGIGTDVTVQVYFAPQVLLGRTKYEVDLGGDLTIPCAFEAAPLPDTVAWFKNSLPIALPSGDGRLSGGSVTAPALIISDLHISDSGFYKCHVTSSVGTGSGPVIRVDTDLYTTKVGNNVTLVCSANAYPQFSSVTWYKDNVSLGVQSSLGHYYMNNNDNSSLTVSGVVPDDMGAYVCEVTNAAGTSQSDVITLNVLYAPMVNVGQTSYTRKEGDTLQIPCSYDANPVAFVVTWTKDSETIDVISSGGKYSGSTVASPSLTISQLVRDDAGVYACSVNNSVGRGYSSDVTLIVQYAPNVEIPVTSFNRTKGDFVILKCTASALPPVSNITWYKGSVQLTVTDSGVKYSGGTVDTPDLTINTLTGEDTDDYFCEATNSIGSTMGDAVILNVFYEPNVSVPATSYTRKEGETLRIQCSFDANPAPFNVTWTKDAQTVDVINSGGKYSGSTEASPSLTITELTSDDAGTYVCSVENRLGSGHSNGVTVVVNYAPVISTPVTSYNRTTGESVTLECHASAVPAVSSVSWYMNKSQLTVTGGSRGKYSGGTVDTPDLTVDSLTGNDTADYFCRVTNSIVVPDVTVDATSYTENEGNALQIPCSYDANPSATNVTWTKDSQVVDVISSGGKYSGSTTASPTLTINQLTSDDAGIYVCRVENSLGAGHSDDVTVVVNYAPKIETPVTSYNQTKGDSVTLECHATAVPPVSGVTWFKDNDQLTVTSSGGKYSGGTVVTPDLTISSLRGEDTGDYYCRLTNMIGSTNGGVIRLNVLYAPIVSVQNSSYTKTEEETFQIPCSYDASPSAYNVTWTMDSQTVDVTNSGGKYSGSTVASPSLTINQLSSGDAGVYVCHVENVIGSGQSGDVTLVVNYAPVIETPMTSFNQTRGDSVTLECHATAVPPVFNATWYINNQPVNVTNFGTKYRMGTVDTFDLTITSLVGEDNADYFCKATNLIGSTDGPVIRVNVFYTPIVTVGAATYTTTEGDTFQIPCSFDAYPAPFNVTWTKDAETIDVIGSGGKYAGSTLASPNLTISQLTREDAGVYVCLVRNTVGLGYSADTTLVVYYAPKIDTPVTSYNESKGGSVTLQCHASALPQVSSITWYKDGNPLALTGSGRKYSGGTLVTPDLTVSSLGGEDTADYFCQANNSIGSTDGPSIRVEVLYAPEITSTQSALDGLEFTNLTVPCVVDANPSVTQVTWTKDGATLDVSTASYSGGTLGTPSLTILSLDPVDAGSYVCSVTNNLGSDSTGTISVTVKYLPKIDSGTEDELTASQGQSISIPCTISAVPSPTSVAWLQNDVVLDTSDSTRYRVGTVPAAALTFVHLQSSDNCVYRCRVINDVGTAYGKNVTLHVNFKPEIAVEPNLEGNETSTFVIPCNVSALPAITSVTWYKEGQLLDHSDTGHYSGGDATTPSLTILGLRADDAGDYYCEAANPMGTTHSGTTTLEVNYKPVIQMPQTAGGDRGSTVTLSVSITANPPITSVWWRKRGNAPNSFQDIDITDNTKYAFGVLGNPGLQIKNLARTDEGVYEVEATNELGTSSANITVVMSYKPSSVNITGTQDVYKEGEAIQLTCSSEGFPVPDYRWYLYKDNELYNPSSVQTEGQQFTDTASSQYDSVKFTINCDTDSNPEPTSYEWTHNGQVVGTTQRIQITVDNTTDLGSYECRATNSEGTSDPPIVVYISKGTTPNQKIKRDKRVGPAPIVASHPPKAMRGSLPHGGTPRPLYLPPLEGAPLEKDPLEEDKPKEKKKKRKRKKHGDGEGRSSKEATPQHELQGSPRKYLYDDANA
ncbi:hypothetical protein BaRGS_00038931 [Batillaria attramentaria]|uniref:Ig-like domain-containing protein n=1 Tax=Batillaria attramentaria TaxID=370345 RepID=A0ABD0J4S9_9CAEN